MRATGIIRRMDDLGRIIIPKEIRRTLKIREGDPLEIYSDDEGVYFKKYNPCNQIIDEIHQIKKNYATYLTNEQVTAFNNLLDTLKE